ncbi:MAG: cytochrome b [Candidatus Thiodiazotropha sp. (ex Myrtea spinifera)]|nr:cytochrome b [Candidatus Thiodiazotropha sp. (ex Myrtea spinifera)]MCU7829907.1 cytochrome b [Candidatus Thiodiazotropha sp. (ex Myrtea sp. 'scaly one' KF741663)]
MRIRNDGEHYGAIAIGLHWLVALTVFSQFGLGLWMRSLGYYDAWYQLGPWWHKGIGVMLLLAMLLRLVWRLTNPRPAHLETHKPYERLAASLTHSTLYLLLFLITLSGYLISTADGRALEVFDWFSIPATISGIDKQEDIAGEVHFYLAWSVIVLAGVHALAAIKHHFIDHDRTLKRMLGRS